MLTPDFLLRIVDAAEEAADKLNTYLVQRVSKRILALFDKEKEVELIPASISDVRKMREAGMLTDEVQQALKEHMPELQEEIDQAFEAAANEIERDNDRFTEKILRAEDMDVDVLKPHTGRYKPIKELSLTKKEIALLKRAYEKTNGTLYNLTGTTADACQKEYIRACDEAYWKVTHGVSIHTAVADAIDQCAQYGAVVTYPSGHKDKIEVAVARAVRTGANQAAGDISLTRCAELGVSQVIVSSHLGARYTDKDEPANHMSWQGKVYDLDWHNDALRKYSVTPQDDRDNAGKFGFLEKIRYLFLPKKNWSAGDFVKMTGYGTGAGLCGWNCRHSFGPYYKGISTNNTEQFDDEKNKRRYDLEQKQRAAERNLRELRRRMNALKYAASEAKGEAVKRELKERHQNMRREYLKKMDAYDEFCDKNKLKTRKERLKIAESMRAI